MQYTICRFLYNNRYCFDCPYIHLVEYKGVLKKVKSLYSWIRKGFKQINNIVEFYTKGMTSILSLLHI